MCCLIDVINNNNNINNTSMQPPESQARRQSLPLPARKRSMLILMAVTLLNRSPLRYLAYLTHHLASSCVISVGRYLRTQGKSEKRAFCFKDARYSCNVLMPHCSTTVYLLTAPIDCSYLFSFFFPVIFLNPLGIIGTEGIKI